MSVYVDTSAIFALVDGGDEFHDRARTSWRTLLATGEVLLATSYTWVEALSLIQRTLGVVAARDMVDLLAPLLTIEWVGPELHDRSLVYWTGIATRHLNFVDVVSFACMRELKISRVFTYDAHFAAQGFDVVG